jgi:hypothetical protein
MNHVRRRLKSLGILMAAGLISFSPLSWGQDPHKFAKKKSLRLRLKTFHRLTRITPISKIMSFFLFNTSHRHSA